MSTAHHELLPTLLLRAAQGNRSLEAASILLTHTGALDELTDSVVVDLDQNLANEASDLHPSNYQALHHAIDHLTGHP